MWPFCPYKPASFQTCKIFSISKQFSVTKIQMFSFREEKNVRLFDVMTKTSASSDKNVHLTKNKCQQLTVLINILCA